MGDPSTNNPFVELRLSDAALSLRLELPSDWSSQRSLEPVDGPFVDPEGRLHPRLTATSSDGHLRLRISASRFRAPMGLVPAVVYWNQLHGLEPMETHERWDGCEVICGWSPSGNDPTRLEAAAWVATQDAVVELRLDGPRSQRERLEAAWLTIKDGYRATELTDDRPPLAKPEPWWERAKSLRAQGRVDEALDVLEHADMAEALLMQADLHAERMRSATAAGQMDIAREAWRKATSCAISYAASATSGGEGAARSLDRDRLLAEIGPEP